MLFVYNPHAGKGQIKNKLSDVIEIFTNAGYEVTIHPTKARQDATKIVLENDGLYDILVCSGGDGTLNEVTDGIMMCKNKVDIGYLPAGTTNDFAISHKIPREIIKAAETVVKGLPYLYDVGSLNDQFFTYVAAFGAFTDVSYETPQSTKNMFGRLAYILEGVKRLPMLKSYRMAIECDENTIEDEFIFGMVTNSGSIGGFKGFSDNDVVLDDGLFEAVFIKRPMNPLELQNIVNALITKINNSSLIYSYRVSKIQFKSEEIVPWTLDGEFGGEYQEIYIENHRQAIAYMIEKT